MKYILIVIIFSTSIALAQNPSSGASRKNYKSINEISYQMPLAIGYNYIHNFSDRFLIGAGIHAGVCYYLKYIDLLQIKVFTRNAFNKNKFIRKVDYDIGLFYSYPYTELEIDAAYGLTTSVYYNFWKLKIGGEILTSVLTDNDNKEFRYFLFTPVLMFNF
ncbi:MAG: hypothetical protein FJY07_02430 [Bacteroidetes bacterium]|nr:hypothetical protein [Bacteroidota bacterium]